VWALLDLETPSLVKTTTVEQAPPEGFLNRWFRPKRFETEQLYTRLGARVLKRYVPTGGDLAMGWLRRREPQRRWLDPGSLESLHRFERTTRLNEAVHLLGFAGFTALALKRFSAGSLTPAGLSIGLGLNLGFGLWPVVLQRYNRLRVYRAIEASTRRRSDRGFGT
jgi:hypothetical protein